MGVGSPKLAFSVYISVVRISGHCGGRGTVRKKRSLSYACGNSLRPARYANSALAKKNPGTKPGKIATVSYYFLAMRFNSAARSCGVTLPACSSIAVISDACIFLAYLAAASVHSCAPII